LDREIQNVRGRGYGFRENSCCFRDESELGSENSSRSLANHANICYQARLKPNSAQKSFPTAVEKFQNKLKKIWIIGWKRSFLKQSIQKTTDQKI